jgi:hypothetical protein
MYSRKHKFIFVHPQKCSGTSIKKALDKTFGKENLIREDEDSIQMLHLGLDQLDYYIDDDLSSYFKFSVVRNPWDRFVSHYFHIKKFGGYKESFGIYCRKIYENGYPNHAKMKRFMSSPKMSLDFIMRFENLDSDFDLLMKKMGIKEYSKLEKYNHGTDRGDRDYRSFYNERTKNIISELCEWEIKEFGYEF